MIKNYLKTAWRNLIRDKAFSVINITGLAIGMAGALLIAVWLQHMLTMDRFHEKGDRLYVMCNRDVFNDGQTHAWDYTPRIMASTLKAEYPDVEGVTRYDDENHFLMNYGEKKVMGKTVFADPDFFQMFSYQFVRGNEVPTFKNISSIIITEKFAHAVFGNEDPMGKVFTLDQKHPVTVTAVLKDLPENTQMKFDCMLSWDYAASLDYVDSSWTNNTVQTFVLLHKNVNLASFNNKVKNITISHGNPNNRPTTQVFAHSYEDHYLYNGSKDGEFTTGRIEQVKLFSIIGIFILLIACINFMNLSTARSEKRAREIGVRKVMGASKISLIGQFITESLIVSFVAFLIAGILVMCCLPFLNNLVDLQLSLKLLNTNTWLFALLFVVITGLLAGSYPAFFLSSFRPIASLKGTFKINQFRIQPRSVLVILQFTFAIILIISTIIVSRQINYTQERNNGYDKSGLVYTPIVGDLSKNYLSLREELLQSGAVIAVSKTMSPITERFSDGWGLSWTGSTVADAKTDFIRFSADADLTKTIKMSLVAGRDIDVYKYQTDSLAMLLNESAVKAMHLSNPLEAIVKDQGKNWHVVGVVKDFIIESPYDKIQPLIILGPSCWFNTIHYRLNPAQNRSANMATISGIFKKYNPAYSFEYHFADDMYGLKFKDTQMLQALATFFAALAIAISCIGLLGMVSYLAKARRKEIAIRKILGATLMHISYILSRSFLILVVIAIAIASPVAWYFTSNWLSGYHYRIAFPWWTIGAAGMLAIAITLTTISIQTIGAALANPVKSLQAE